MRWSHRFMYILLLVALLSICGHPYPVEAQDGLQISITQVDGSRFPMVTIYVSILGAGGKPAVGLQAGELSVREDGQEVEVVEFNGSGGVPVSTLLVLDRSGSMMGDKLAGAQSAALSFVDLMREQDKVGLLLFAGTSVLAETLTDDQESLKRSIAQIQLADDTALYDAVVDSLVVLEPVSGRKSAIVLSDGIDNQDSWAGPMFSAGSSHTLDEAVERAGESGVTLYTIGLGQHGDLNEEALEQIAEQTGGRYFYAPSADELAALYGSLAQQLQTEYTLTYRSPRPSYDGTRRDIEVVVNAHGGLNGSGGNSYLEQHLLQVRSAPVVGIALLALLLIALFGPLLPYRRRPALAHLGAPASPPHVQPVHQPQSAPSSQTCRFCSAALRRGARFCNACGQRQD